MPRDNFETTMQVIQALGSVATFLAFLFLFRRDKNKDEQLKELKALAETNHKQFLMDQKRNKISFLPWLFVHDHSYKDNDLTIQVINRGRTIHVRKLVAEATGFRFVLRDEKFDFHTEHIQMFVYKVGTSYEQDTKRVDLLKIYFKDQIGNFYISILEGNSIDSTMRHPVPLNEKEVKELRLNVEELDQDTPSL